MKILKYILFFIIGLIVLFLAFGLLDPEVEYGHEISVNKPIEEAWAVTQDESKYGEWLEGFKSMELISGDAGQVGSQYKVIVNPGEGQPDFEMTETVDAIEEFEYVDLSFDSDFMDFEQRISFREEDGSTFIKSDSKVIGKSIMSKSMFSLMETLGGSFTKQEAKNFEALKQLIDSNTTNYYPVEEIATDSLSVEQE